MGFLELRQEPGVYSRVSTGWSFKIRVCSSMSGLLSSYEGHLRNFHEAWQGIMRASRGETGDQGPLSSCHSDILIPINFR